MQLAVFVAAEFERRIQADDARRTRIVAERLATGVEHRPPVAHAQDRRQQRQRGFERHAVHVAVLRIHHHVRARLHVGDRVVGSGKERGARSARRDDAGCEPGFGKRRSGRAQERHRTRIRRTPFGDGGDVLYVAFVALQAAQTQPRQSVHDLAQGHGRRAGCGSGAVLADVDVHQRIDAQPGCARGGRECRCRLRIVDHDRYCSARGEREQPPDFGRTDDLGRDQDVRNAAVREHFRFGELRAAHADRAALELHVRDAGGLVRLGMRPKFDRGRRDERRHAIEVALDPVEVEQQRRRVDVRHAQSHVRRMKSAMSGAMFVRQREPLKIP